MNKVVFLLILSLLLSYFTASHAQIIESFAGSVYLAEPGEYIVGIDIPAGTYSMELSDYKTNAGILINNPGDYGTTVMSEWFGEYTGIYEHDEVEINDGQLIYVYSNNVYLYPAEE